MKPLAEMSDSEIEAAVAEHVAGYKGRFMASKVVVGPFVLIRFSSGPNNEMGDYSRYYRADGVKVYCGKPHQSINAPRYLTDANAVLPLLEKQEAAGFLQVERWHKSPLDPALEWAVGFIPKAWHNSDENDGPEGTGYLQFMSRAPTFCRAACLALLRAHGFAIAEGEK